MVRLVEELRVIFIGCHNFHPTYKFWELGIISMHCYYFLPISLATLWACLNITKLLANLLTTIFIFISVPIEFCNLVSIKRIIVLLLLYRRDMKFSDFVKKFTKSRPRIPFSSWGRKWRLMEDVKEMWCSERMRDIERGER